MDTEYEIDVEHHVTANLADCWTWEVDWADGNAAGTTYVDESTARICAQAVIDALSPCKVCDGTGEFRDTDGHWTSHPPCDPDTSTAQPTTPTDAEEEV